MRPIGYILILIVTLLAAGASLISLLIFYDPYTSGALLITLFYLSLFFTVSSLLALLGVSWRRLRRRYPLVSEEFQFFIRRGVLLALFLVAILILASRSELTLLRLAGIAAGIIIVEYIFTGGSSHEVIKPRRSK